MWTYLSKRKKIDKTEIAPFVHRAALLSWCGARGEVLPVLQRAKEGCRCWGIHMFSTMSNMQHEICIKLDNNVNNPVLTVFLLQFFCQDQFPGGHLASITSQHVHREVMSMMLRHNQAHTRTWVGGLRYLEVCMFSQGVKVINDHLAFTNHIIRGVNFTAGDWIK